MTYPSDEKRRHDFVPSSRAAHHAGALIGAGAHVPDLRVDLGLADNVLESQLQPERLEPACVAAGIPLTLRRHAGDDHGY